MRDERTLHPSVPRVPAEGAVIIAGAMLGLLARNLYLRWQEYRGKSAAAFIVEVEQLQRHA